MYKIKKQNKPKIEGNNQEKHNRENKEIGETRN